ncbi:hypothetical protein AB0J21_06685 [Streptomyces sp. NPDC049954]|uniref:hypothetical protein n=1 Tax=Streptomyces sp. NPDC049954 TaxID=3155779 RepID=UPI0034463C81
MSGRTDPEAGQYFQALVSSQNGLYYHPFLRNEPAGVEAQSYALAALAETGSAPRVSLNDQEQSALHEEAVAMSALWGRYSLIAFRRAGASRVLGPSDVEAVRGLRREDGLYQDPDLDTRDTAALVGSTWAALEVLHAVGALEDLPADAISATAGRLRRLADSTEDLSEAGALATSLRLLSQPVPEHLARLRAPSMERFTSLSADERTARLVDTYGYVQVRESSGERPVLDTAAWRQVLRHNAGTLDYEQLFYAVHILRSTGPAEPALDAARRRLEGNRLRNGTVRDPDTYSGSLDASLWVERLRSLAGWTTRDRRLTLALDDTARSAGHGPDDDGDRARAALRRLAGPPGRPTASPACEDRRLLPTPLTVDNAPQWQRGVMECVEAGGSVPVPTVRRWRLNTPSRVAAVAALVVGLRSAHHGDAVPDWVTAKALAPWARNPARFTSVHDYAQVVRAHLILGGDLEDGLRSALRRGVGPYKGCPGTPDLYRTGGPDPGCDLRTTWAVWALDRQTRGALGALPPSAAPAATEGK